MKSYASAGQSLLLLIVIPAYAALARRVGRVRLLVSVYGFFVTNLLVFAALLQAGVEIGVPFYLWVGVFNNTAMWLTPVLALVRLGKIAENSLDYSLQNTARQALFLVGTRAEKYLGKTVIDTIVVRAGDVFSSALIYGAALLHLPSRTFALFNLGFVACWLRVVVGLGREHARRSAQLQQSVLPNAELAGSQP
ncbi:MAG TPA: hypothetical protein VFN67_20205 [Polyangiales bacterium]|nr:hypothetical protein [Polyangiales bacterium]